MENQAFIKVAKEAVLQNMEVMYEHNALGDELKEIDFHTEVGIYVVWSTFILGNNKAIISTTNDDGLYFEVTYNNNQHEMYVDSYTKMSQTVYDVEGSKSRPYLKMADNTKYEHPHNLDAPSGFDVVRMPVKWSTTVIKGDAL